MIPKNGTICGYGDTGSGKTTQAGELVLAVKEQTGLNSHLLTTDSGGLGPIEHLKEVGILDVTRMDIRTDCPPIWSHKAVTGQFDQGKEYGLHIFDSGTGISEKVFKWCKEQSGKGVNIGGKGSYKVVAKQEGENDLTIGGSTLAHYSLTQGHIKDLIWHSECLPGLVFWTFTVKRGEGEEAGTMLGPQVEGKAITTDIPRWFNWTFRFLTETDTQGNVKHKLLTRPHKEAMGAMQGFGNARMPLAAKVVLPPCIEPTSIVQALEIIQQGKDEAVKAIQEKLK